jgi:hypothetical protein
MYVALIQVLFVIVASDCATSGQAFPWPMPKEFGRVCSLLGIGCVAGVLTGCRRRGQIESPDGRVALAVAAGFLVCGVINVFFCLTR